MFRNIVYNIPKSQLVYLQRMLQLKSCKAMQNHTGCIQHTAYCIHHTPNTDFVTTASHLQRVQNSGSDWPQYDL